MRILPARIPARPTITLFFVFQGATPAFWSAFSDSFGRRPVYLAWPPLPSSLWPPWARPSWTRSTRPFWSCEPCKARAAQPSSLSPTPWLADGAGHSERGRYTAPMMTAANVGPCIGPILGGGVVLLSGGPAVVLSHTACLRGLCAPPYCLGTARDRTGGRWQWRCTSKGPVEDLEESSSCAEPCSTLQHRSSSGVQGTEKQRGRRIRTRVRPDRGCPSWGQSGQDGQRQTPISEKLK
jgi:hypothetical protein